MKQQTILYGLFSVILLAITVLIFIPSTRAQSTLPSPVTLTVTLSATPSARPSVTVTLSATPTNTMTNTPTPTGFQIMQTQQAATFQARIRAGQLTATVESFNVTQTRIAISHITATNQVNRLLTATTKALIAPPPTTPQPLLDLSTLKPITAANATQVTQLAHRGYGTANGIAWSPDSQTLAVAGSLGIWLYAANHFVAQPRLLESQVGTQCVAFSPDGTLLATGNADATVSVWNIKSGGEQLVLLGHAGSIASIAFSPDGSLLASAAGDGIRLWDVKSGTQRALLKILNDALNRNAVNSVVFSPDGTLLASAGHEGPVRLWDVRTGVQRLSLDGNMNNVAFSPDGALLAYGSASPSGMGGGEITLLDVKTGNIHTSWKADSTYGIVFSPDGKTLITAGGPLQAWDVETQTRIYQRETRAAFAFSMAFSPNGKMFAYTGALIHTVEIYEEPGGSFLSELNYQNPINALAFNLNGSIIATVGQGDSLLWDIRSGIIGVGPLLAGYSKAVAYSPDGVLLATFSSSSVLISNLQTGAWQNVMTVSNGGDTMGRLIFSPDGATLVLVNYILDNRVQFWDVKNNRLRLILDDPGIFVLDVIFNPDGTFLLIDVADNAIELRNVNGSVQSVKSRIPFSFKYFPGPGTIALNPDRTLLAISTRTTLTLWNLTTNTQQSILTGDQGTDSIIFSPDGSLLASSGSGNIRLWDVKTGTQQAVLKGNVGVIADIAFSPDGTLLVSGGMDGTLRVWGVRSGN